MDSSDWLMITAVLMAPVFAVQAQKYLEALRERHSRKSRIFYTLMATRAARLSIDHVQALNMIDIEFYGRKLLGVRYQSTREKRIVAAWRTYLDHLTNSRPESEVEIQSWLQRGDDLFVDLLYEMSRALGYDFDRVHLRRGVYWPRRHGEEEQFQRVVREQVLKLLSGELALPVELTSIPVSEENSKTQAAVQERLLEHLEGIRPVRVMVERTNSGKAG